MVVSGPKRKSVLPASRFVRQDAIEADEVIHVEVGQKDCLQVGQAFQRQAGKVSGIKEEGIVLAGIIEEQDRIARGAVDELDLGYRAGRGHGRSRKGAGSPAGWRADRVPVRLQQGRQLIARGGRGGGVDAGPGDGRVPELFAIPRREVCRGQTDLAHRLAVPVPPLQHTGRLGHVWPAEISTPSARLMCRPINTLSKPRKCPWARFCWRTTFSSSRSRSIAPSIAPDSTRLPARSAGARCHDSRPYYHAP